MLCRQRYNSSNINVYAKDSDGKGRHVLCLVWRPDEPQMSKISVFLDFRSHLSPTFQRLLSFEAIDNNSAFKKRFLGYANKSAISLDLPELGTKLQTYSYYAIGLEVIHKQFRDHEKVVFAIVRPQP